MINKDFYPTPKDVIYKMIDGECLEGKYVLEPSAGKGDILNILNELGAITSYCEIEQSLQRIIGANSKFIGSDFLKLRREDVSHFDFIIMNPPFSKDDEHILHAWNIAPDGCTVLSLCNYETLNNPYTKKRTEILSIISQYGTFENLGSCFDYAERITGIDIGFIKLTKPSVDKEDWSEYFDKGEYEDSNEEGLMKYDAIVDCVGRYVSACKLFNEVSENAIKMNNIAGMFGVSGIAFSLKVEEKESNVEDFKTNLKKLAWTWIFNKMNLDKYMTSKLREDLNKFIETQKEVPFTVKNIYRMFDVIVQTHGQRIERAIIEVFDNFTMHHKDNRYAVEGWKTNSHYMLNKKIIIPYIGSQDRCYSYPNVAYDSRYYNWLIDFQKCLCVQEGVDFSTIPCLHHGFFSNDYKYIDGERVETRKAKDWGVWYDWGFFEIRIYKKGTLHMKFKNIDVWARFNQSVAKIKGFELPQNFK